VDQMAAAGASARLRLVKDEPYLLKPDEDLMLAYAAGDVTAFDYLYARHRGGLFRFISRQCSDRAVAEELYQEVWSGLIKARQKYRPEARFATWLYTLAHHRLVDWYRRNSKVVWTSFGGDEDDPDQDESPALRVAQPEVQAESRELAAKLLQLLDQLPPPQREAFLMHEEGGLSVEEIATAAGIPVEAAKSRLRYAVAKLRLGLTEMR